MPHLPPFKTEFCGYAVEFSPFDENRLAVATSQHFGIIGNGQLVVLDIMPDGIAEFRHFDTQDGLYDCSWSEENGAHIVSASGDGTLRLWDLSAPDAANPLRSYEEHTHEVYSVDWNVTSKDTFISGSWDDSIKLWSPVEPHSLHTWKEHSYCIYSTVWSPTSHRVFASASGDCTVKIWDVNEPHSVQTIRAHDHEVLTCDWNKYDDNILVTGSVDKTVRLWDLRNTAAPLSTLHGHDFAVRRVKCSPHSENIICSVSYDMSAIIWDLSASRDPLVFRHEHHSEFALGIDFSLFHEGQVVTCAWDESVVLFQQDEPLRPPH